MHQQPICPDNLGGSASGAEQRAPYSPRSSLSFQIGGWIGACRGLLIEMLTNSATRPQTGPGTVWGPPICPDNLGGSASGAEQRAPYSPRSSLRSSCTVGQHLYQEVILGFQIGGWIGACRGLLIEMLTNSATRPQTGPGTLYQETPASTYPSPNLEAQDHSTVA
jgi:hypothetical protein